MHTVPKIVHPVEGISRHKIAGSRKRQLAAHRPSTRRIKDNILHGKVLHQRRFTSVH